MVQHKIGIAKTDSTAGSIWIDDTENYAYAGHYSFPINTNAMNIDIKYTAKWKFNEAGGKGDFNFLTWKGFDRRSIIIDGIFTTRTQVDDFNKTIGRVALKKIYLENDRFYIGSINEPKVTRSGNRGPNIRDWLVEFFCFDPFQYSDVLKYYPGPTAATFTHCPATFGTPIPVTNNGTIYSMPAFNIKKITGGTITRIDITSPDPEGGTQFLMSLKGTPLTNGDEVFLLPYFYKNDVSTGITHSKIAANLDSIGGESDIMNAANGASKWIRIAPSGAPINITITPIGSDCEVRVMMRDTYL